MLRHPIVSREEEAIRRRLIGGSWAGLFATLLMTAFALSVPALAGGRLPPEVGRLAARLPGEPLVFLAALGLHLGYGALAGALFAALAREVNVSRGMLYGLGLWTLAVTVYAPLVGLGYGAAREPALALLALPAHLLYGAALGATGPRGEILQAG